MSSPNRMLDCITSGLVNQSKAGKSFFILHLNAEPLIFIPVLQSSTTPNYIDNNKLI